MRDLFRRLRWVTLLLVTLAVVLDPAPAGAHATLTATEPAAGSTVASFDRIVLRFGEEVEAAGSHVLIHNGREAQPLDSVHYQGGDRTTLIVDVPPIIDGTYTVAWHVLAIDGDAQAGEFSFTLDAGAVGPPPGADPSVGTAAPVGAAASVGVQHDHGARGLPAAGARLVVDLALATLVGGLVFVAAVWPAGARLVGTRWLLAASAGTAAVASVGLAVLEHTAGASTGWGDLLQFRFGQVALARLVLLALAVLPIQLLHLGGSATARALGWRLGTGLLSLGLLETVVLQGHSGRAAGVDAAARLVHTIGLSVWLGGLLMLFVVVLPRRHSEELVAVLPKFSVLATGAVGVLVLAGMILSVDLVGAAGALPGTAYGQVLLVKLGAVAVLLAAASRSRAHVRHRLRGAATVGPVVTWVGVELGLMAVVFALTALLVSQAPPG